MTSLLISLIIAGVLLLLTFFGYYNKFIVLTQRIKNSKAQINVQLKKRSDLIPNLVNIVKGYMKHEKSLLTEVTKARTNFLNAKNFEEKVKVGSELQHSLKNLFAVAENYPEVKANQSFVELQREVSAIEDKIAYSRQYYNDSIMTYNNSIEVIPGKWFASLYHFKKENYFEIPEEEKINPVIEF